MYSTQGQVEFTHHLLCSTKEQRPGFSALTSAAVTRPLTLQSSAILYTLLLVLLLAVNDVKIAALRFHPTKLKHRNGTPFLQLLNDHWS